MILDDAIHVLAIFAVIASLLQRQAVAVASLLFISLWYNGMILLVKPDPAWNDLVFWCVLFAVKDLLFLTLLGFRKNTAEFILLLSFAVSCLFHQAILAQVLTYEASKLTLFAIRPEIMMYLSVAQLATVFYIILGGGFNGGKRAKRSIPVNDIVRNRLLYPQAFKVKK